MALKNATQFRVTTRDLTTACDPRVLKPIITSAEDGEEDVITFHPDAAKDVVPKLTFLGIQDNKISAKVEISMKINGYEVLLVGEPLISLNHFELQLTGDSAKLSPEEAEKIQKRIQALQDKLAAGVMPTESELNGED